VAEADEVLCFFPPGALSHDTSGALSHDTSGVLSHDTSGVLSHDTSGALSHDCPQKKSCSFLKKRTKKLLSVLCAHQ